MVVNLRLLTCVALTVFTMTVTAAAQRAAAPEAFQPPKRTYDADGRSFAKLSWVTTEWKPEADQPFLAVHREVSVLRSYAGSRTDRTDWAAKTKRAHAEWRVDSQNPVKLFAASAHYGGIPPKSLTTPEFQKIQEELHLGWYVLRKPPRSYVFVRMGYRFCAGDGDRHLFGDLGKALLKRDPLDRMSFRAAVRELADERPRWSERKKTMVQLPGKGQDFEDFLLKVGLQMRGKDVWRPWDDGVISDIYFARAYRTKSRGALEEAIEWIELAIKNSPADFDKTYLVEHRQMLDRAKQWATKP